MPKPIDSLLSKTVLSIRGTEAGFWDVWYECMNSVIATFWKGAVTAGSSWHACGAVSKHWLHPKDDLDTRSAHFW